MRTTTAATNWRWQRARSTGKEKVSTKAREAVERETAFIGRKGRKCRFSGMNPRRMWKKISAKLNFAEKGSFFQTFTNCSHQTHNSAKFLGILSSSKGSSQTRCVFSLLTHTARRAAERRPFLCHLERKKTRSATGRKRAARGTQAGFLSLSIGAFRPAGRGGKQTGCRKISGSLRPPRGGPSCVIWNERKPVRLREGRELREELLLCRLSRVLVKGMSAV